MNASQLVHCNWFRHYYERYKFRIDKKSKSQQLRHHRQKKKLNILPYYSLHGKHCLL